MGEYKKCIKCGSDDRTLRKCLELGIYVLVCLNCNNVLDNIVSPIGDKKETGIAKRIIPLHLAKETIKCDICSSNTRINIIHFRHGFCEYICPICDKDAYKERFLSYDC